jgi:hypothetical protein
VLGVEFSKPRFEYLDHADQFIIADQRAHGLWYIGRAELDRDTCNIICVFYV